ncbi:MAG: hypothetical protein P4M00_03195, partial [Azospirillaceae bacterium]|nr:hypothetical protein [Azospirillaceae bacterium]
MTRRFLYRAIGWCTGTIALIAVGLGILLVLMRSELIERVATLDDSILYVAAQSEVDLLRLTTAGQRYVAGDPKMTPDLLRERVDVLYSRVETIVQGDLRQLGATVPEYVTAVQKLKAYLAGIDATWG